MALRKARKKRIINQRHMLIAEVVERRPEIMQSEIVRYLKDEYGISVSQQTVSNDLKVLKQVHWQRSHKAMQSIRDNLLNEYQTIYAEAMAAWYLSLENKEVLTIESVSKPETPEEVETEREKIKEVERTEGQSGNPALLAQARGALQDIEDLLGLEAPKKEALDLTSGGESLGSALEKILAKTYESSDS